jgi:predicted nucleic acid-binding protein
MPSYALTARPRGTRSGRKAHTADRWIAATAMRLGIPLVSNDGIFRDAPGVELETLASA